MSSEDNARGAIERVEKRMADQYEQNTGRRPDGDQARMIAAKAREAARRAERRR